jgi:deazaflavin-dependent oxidoreductase (nitroreductase family)
VRRLNAVQAWLAARGVGPRHVVALEVVGRRTGRTISFPVVVADFKGDRYLVSMLGDSTNWVRNVRAARGHAVLRLGRRQAVRLHEVPPGERAPILRRYRQCAPGARSHLPLDPGAPLEQFERIAARYPVFRITTAATGGPDAPGPGRDCTLDLAIAIRRPPHDVYALLADIQDAEPIPRRAVVQMVKNPAGPTVAGTRWHERVRFAPGRWLHVDSEVTDADPPSRLGMDFHSRWFTGHLTYDIDGTADGIVLHHRETLRPRLLLRASAPFIQRHLEAHIQTRLEDIKRLLETRDASAPAGVGALRRGGRW